jgi:outer membrane protein assembly factor BamB
LKACELPQADGAFKLLWKSSAPSSQFQIPSPVYHAGIVYSLSADGILQANDAKTGERHYRQRLPVTGSTYPSLAIAGDLLFASANAGRTVVIVPGLVYKELSINDLEPFTGTPIFAGNRIYLRGEKQLYCITQSTGKRP